MNPKPVALPRPPRIEAAMHVALEGAADPERTLRDMLRRREVMALELGIIDAEVERFAMESICGLADDTQDVERYDGSLGVTRAFVDAHERPVGQLQWLDDLSQRFSGAGEAPGNVSGVRWGSGGLFADDLFLTAGHCFDPSGGGWERPRRSGVTIAPDEIAMLMRVNFNFQVDGTSGQRRAGEAFPVTQLLEYRLGGLDFAIVRVGRNQAGRLPGEVFGRLALASENLTQSGAILCLIQHPSGRPKKIEAGPLLHTTGAQIAYDSLDTEGGSSGAPILSPDGEIVGVHTNGGCSAFSGFNFGVPIDAVRSASAVIE